jgi:membrane-bound inhibitor of C-type lysozyme
MDGFFRTIRLTTKIGFTEASVALMLSCSQANHGTEHKWLSFGCPNGQTVMARFEAQDQFVEVRFAGSDLRLPHVISGSGARYSDGKTTFWNKGQSALVEVNDKIVVQDCMLQVEPPG